MNKRKLLLFGAGKIGRSFIGQLFGESGYEIVLVDIDQHLVDQLNEASAYHVMFRDSNHPEKEKSFVVENITAVHISDKENIIKQLIESDITALSVGKRGLSGLAPVLAEGIEARYKVRKDYPIDIILAENVRNAAGFLHEEISKYISDVPLGEYLGLIETSIGKMVPNITKEQLQKDPLALFSEPYNSLIVDAQGFKNDIPDVKGLAPKTHMKAWVDRKIFIHNMGHVCLAYHTNNLYPDIKYTWEALEIKPIRDIVRKTMLQSADILVSLYPDVFTSQQLIAHTDDLLERFSNRALGDTIFRVGCDLPRKLGINDRLMIPILKGIKAEKDYSLILEAWVKGCSFRAVDENGKMFPEDDKFKLKYSEDPLSILENFCNLSSEINIILREGIEKILTDSST